jgi:6-phosphofructokinase 1
MRIGVFTSGGDAPGMNACVRAVVRTAGTHNCEVVGIRRGYRGLLDETFYKALDGREIMSMRSVSGIAKLGGTILHTSRCPEMHTEEGLKRAAEVLEKHKIEGLIPIGGDGTFRGAEALCDYWDGKVVGCPGTIDNDLIGTDFTIGFKTAVQTAVSAVDKIRDTAESHERMFLIEVMGRHSGYIGLFTAIAAGAEIVAIPETEEGVDEIVTRLHQISERGKTSVMMVVSEGDELGDAYQINEALTAAGNPFNTRVVKLGHLQRGGSPTADDRILASYLGYAAVAGLLEGRTQVMAGWVHGELKYTPFVETYDQHKPVPRRMIDLLEFLSR